jgi:8-oxo-dGTP pyrophosphatase MutT (NUDIX family)
MGKNVEKFKEFTLNEDMNNIKKPTIAVLAVIQNEQGDILGVSRKYDRSDFGLPGGKVDPGEDIYSAMVREVMEETSLIVLDADPLYFGRVGNTNTHACVYHVTRYSGNIHTTEEGDVKWVDWETVKQGTYGEFNKSVEKIWNMSFNDL